MQHKTSQAKAVSLRHTAHYALVSGFYMVLALGIFMLTSH